MAPLVGAAFLGSSASSRSKEMAEQVFPDNYCSMFSNFCLPPFPFVDMSLSPLTLLSSCFTVSTRPGGKIRFECQGRPDAFSFSHPGFAIPPPRAIGFFLCAMASDKYVVYPAVSLPEDTRIFHSPRPETTFPLSLPPSPDEPSFPPERLADLLYLNTLASCSLSPLGGAFGLFLRSMRHDRP